MNRYLVIGNITHRPLEHEYIHARTPEQAREYFVNKVKIRELCDGNPLPDVSVNYVVTGEDVRVLFH